MAYAQVSLDQLALQLADSLDDLNERYWTRLEKYYAITEALRVWGAYTSFWRTRGSFDLGVGRPYNDLSAKLPLLRPRTVTLQTLVQEIQFHLLEAPNGIGGAGMSGQVKIQSILNAVARARNRFVIDSSLPLVHVNALGPTGGLGKCDLDPSVVYVHRAGWQDAGGRWANLWRQDEWAFDKSNPSWITNPRMPVAFSQAVNSPLTLQLYPPPSNAGQLELVTANSTTLDLTNPATNINFPDEWVHGIKYAALNDLFGTGMIFDPLRAQYCETRYQQAVSGITKIKTIIRLIYGNQQVPIDTFAAIDAGNPYWRNQSGPPLIGGALNDFLITTPVPDFNYGVSVDVVQSAPIPVNGSDFVQIGLEQIDNILDYCINYLYIKCGGKDMQDTFSNYDSFMGKVDLGKGTNEVDIVYMNPLLNQGEKEEDQRPTRALPKTS